MLEDFITTLTTCCRVRPGMSVLACCSGGRDSMVLLELLTRCAPRLDLTIAAVHVDHGLRGLEAQQDAAFVRDWCAQQGTPCEVRRLHMDPAGANLEEEARARRREVILGVRAELGFDLAATGHTLDDQAETLIYRLVRGSGIRGLGAMDFSSPEGIVRPLLAKSRAQVADYARRRQIACVHDRSNDDPRFVRNRIRHEILPALESINPQVATALFRLSRIARSEGLVLEKMARDLTDSAMALDWGIVKVLRLGALLSAPDAVVRRCMIALITDMLHESRGIDAIQVEQVMEVVAGQRRAHSLRRAVEVARLKESLVFRCAFPGPYYDLEVDSSGVYRLPGIGQDLRVTLGPRTCGPLRLRSLLPGDRLLHKRVVELLAQRGVGPELRPYWPVALQEGRLIAVTGVTSALSPIRLDFV